MSRVSARIGRRGAALLFFTLLDVVYAAALLTAPLPLTPQYMWMTEIAPLPVWAAGWAATAAICALYAFRAYDTPAFVAAVALKVAWGLTTFFGWLAGQVDRGWVLTVIWLAFAAFVALIAGGIPPAPRRERGGEGGAWTR